MSDQTATIKGITKQLEAIRDERMPYANTATRIGEALLSLLSLYQNTPYVKKEGEQRLVIGDIYLSWDKENNAVKVSKADGSAANFYAVGGISAFGAGSIQGDGGSGMSYERLDNWADYSVDKATAVLSAFLGNDLHERLKKVEGGALTSVDWSIIRNKPNEFTPAAHSHTFASLLNKPTTLQGYGITDAASISHTHAFSALTNKPTTVDGYGIVDTFKTHREVNFAPDEAGYYAVMTTKSGIDETWRHVISMDWSKNDSVNWISQLALPTFVNSDVYYRKNEAQGKQIKDAKWIKIWDEKNLTKLSQLTDDVVSGKYLPLTGGTLNGNLNILDNKLYAWNISGENSAFNFSHAIHLGHQNYNRCKFFEYGGVFEFYKSDDVQNNDESGAKLLGKITEKGWEGNASTADTINIKAQQSRPLKGTEMPQTGLNVYNIYENGYPVGYGNLLSIKGYGGSELAMQWQANSDVGRMLYRSKRDVGGWSEWATIAYLTDNVASATKLKDSRLIWGQSFDGTKNIDGPLIIGDIKISYDEKNGALALTRVSSSDKKANLYATGGLTAFGAGSAQGGGSGTSYERLDKWSDYTTAKAAAVLSAFLGNDLNERLKKVEGGALTSVDWSIIKNKPASMPASDVPAWAKAATKPSYAWSEITGKPNEFNPAAHSHSFASLLNKPTTLQGYGITDAASISHTHAFSALTNKPTTVDGYGIVDTFKTHREVNFAPDEAGYYAVMTTKSGIDETWRHVISMDWSKNDSVNWISQLALPTFVNSDVYYRKNEAQGKQIKDAKWIKIWDEKNLTKLSQLTDDVVSGKYLPLTGGTLNGNLTVDGYLSLANNVGLTLKDKEGSNQRALFISSSNTVYFGCNDRPLYTLFEGDELQFNVYNKGWQNALVISRDRTAIFTGNVLAQGGVTAYTTSDRRLKENIKQVDSMRIIRSLGGTWQFDYKDTGEHSIGFIAQSVKGSVLRNMVYTDAKGYLKLNYLDTRLIALALGAAVQVDDKVERLKKRIKVLETEIEQLKGGEK